MSKLINETNIAECDCSKDGTNSCDPTNGNCACKEGFCGLKCQDNGSTCCQEGFYYDDTMISCKGTFKTQNYQQIQSMKVCFNNTECDCSDDGTNSCDPTNGKCTCKDGFCGLKCTDNDSTCCQQGFYFDSAIQACKGLYPL